MSASSQQHLRIGQAPDVSATSAPGVVQKTILAVLRILTGFVVVLTFLPVVVLPFITSVPIYLVLLLLLLDAGLVLAWFRYTPAPRIRVAMLAGFVAVAGAAVILSQAFAATPAIVDAGGNPLPNSIATMETVDLNGSEQWITIRGNDVNKPVLLFLAGGPGGSELPSTRMHLSALEEHFVVVNWDQPGAAKSYGAVDVDTLTPEQYVADGHALVQHLRTRFDEDKIYVMGESWGTILGIWLVQAYPDLFYAYVGSGQMVNTTENDVMGYEFALNYLAERGDTGTLERLRRNGPPPYTEGNLILTYATYLGVLNDYMAGRETGQDVDILIDAIREPEYGLLDKVNWLRGLMDVFNVVYPQLADLDLATQAAQLEVPVYMILGRHDVNAMTSLAENYFTVLDAPHKELIWFEKSGHPPLYTEAEKLVDIMANRVLPQTYPGMQPLENLD